MKVSFMHIFQISVLAAGVGFGWIIGRKHKQGKVQVEQMLKDAEQYAQGG